MKKFNLYDVTINIASLFYILSNKFHFVYIILTIFVFLRKLNTFFFENSCSLKRFKKIKTKSTQILVTSLNKWIRSSAKWEWVIGIRIGWKLWICFCDWLIFYYRMKEDYFTSCYKKLNGFFEMSAYLWISFHVYLWKGCWSILINC